MMIKAARLLLIDDDRDYGQALGTRLKQDGFEVIVAESGRRGLEAADGEPFDLILLDLLMPQQDGAAVYDELRAHPKTKHVPVILLTGTAEQGYWAPFPHENEEMGRLAFILGKPLAHDVLLMRIRQLLSLPKDGL